MSEATEADPALPSIREDSGGSFSSGGTVGEGVLMSSSSLGGAGGIPLQSSNPDPIPISMEVCVEPEAIREAAREWGITRITFYPAFTATRCEVKNAGASGPYLTDYEAAVLVADGMSWSVWQEWRRP